MEAQQEEKDMNHYDRNFIWLIDWYSKISLLTFVYNKTSQSVWNVEGSCSWYKALWCNSILWLADYWIQLMDEWLIDTWKYCKGLVVDSLS